MFLMRRMINAVEIDDVEIFIREKNKRCNVFLFEPRRACHILWIDDPDDGMSLQCLRVFNQLHELVIAPRSPLAAHEKEHDGFARAQFLRQ